MSKLVEYVGFYHVLKEQIQESWTQYWNSSSDFTTTNNAATTSSSNVVEGGVDQGSGNSDTETNFRVKVKERLDRLKKQTIRRIDRSSSVDEDYSHLTRPKSRKELLQISAAVMGIEFAYAAETAFVSPLLLNLGLRHRHMTMMWCLSPLVGLFVTPLLGSLSDGCRSALGRRRPFILLLSIGIILGLMLVPNGKTLGRMFGDTYKDDPPGPTSTTTAVPIRNLALLTNAGKRNDHHGFFLFHNLTQASFERADDDPNPNGRKESKDTSFSAKDKTTAYFSKYTPTLDEHGFRARNNLATADDEENGAAEFLKGLRIHQGKNKKKKKNLFAVLGSSGESKEEVQGEDEIVTSSSILINYLSQSQSQPYIGLRSGLKNKEEGKANYEVVAAEKSPVVLSPSDNNEDKSRNEDENSVKNHPWGLVFTVLGTVLLDFDADACQSPARAYMLDVTIPEDHARGLSTFTVMAGLGGSLGYFLGALNWENTFLGDFFGGQVRAVFALVLFIFIGCVITTIRSFREIPLDRLWTTQSSGSGAGIGVVGGGGSRFVKEPNKSKISGPYARFEDESADDIEEGNRGRGYGATGNVQETSFSGGDTNGENVVVHHVDASTSTQELPTFKEYLKTIVQLPKSLQWLCLTNFFCWMSLVCYSLYFTDFVGEAVFNGDPTAPVGTVSRKNYDDGIRFACFGMSLYSLSCSIYSLCIESLVSRFGAKRVYITGQLVYSVGMVLMALFRHPLGVIVFSWTAGIMYATLFTMPYLLVARYHAAETFDVDIDDLVTKPSQVRGLGTDVAIVSSMVFLAQMTQATVLGSIVAAVGSTTAIVCAASVFAACGALSATKVLYLDL